jgi:DNA-directed RNA polymerase specialized sigma subunit
MVKIFYLFGFLYLFIHCFCAPVKYLSKQQWIDIHKVLLHKGITPEMRSDINKVLYKHFEGWAIHKTYVFNRYHSYTCRNINFQDLTLYSCNSLHQAIAKYKPKEVYNDTSQFLNYVGKCIDGGLYTGLTELYPITILPKNIRKQKRTLKTKYLYKNELDTVFLTNTKISSLHSNNNANNTFSYKSFNHNYKHQLLSKYEYIEIWNEINKDFPSLVKKIMQLKYNYEFDIIRTNKEIGDMLGFSQQKVRTNIQKARDLLSTKFE